MSCRLCSFLLALLLLAGVARAHLGSPDIFFEGKIGPYPARVTIRMPSVVPGRAEIDVHPESAAPVTVTVLPLFSKTPRSNSPPPEPALPALEEPGLYRGLLWLMKEGGYSVEVRVSGAAGEGAVQIPVHSAATHQLPLPRALAAGLIVLGALLLAGLVGIVRAAAAESTLPPGAPMDRGHRRQGFAAASISSVVCIGALAGGWHWWDLEEAAFRRNLEKGIGPDLTTEVRAEGSQEILRLTLGEKAYPAHHVLNLLPDHGKLLHVFLIGEGGNEAVAHLHPIRQGGKTFEVALPPLPEGDYRIFADFTTAEAVAAVTSTAAVHLPPHLTASTAAGKLAVDPDDSWALSPAVTDSSADAAGTVYRFDDGFALVWQPHPPLRAREDAGLRFEVRAAAGGAVVLEPYMGMISHAAVVRDDSAVFAHLHPTGNFSMAAQMYFESNAAGAPAGAPMDHSKMHHGDMSTAGPATFSLPYEFPSAGDYRVYVQFKTPGQVHTACFRTHVAPEIAR